MELKVLEDAIFQVTQVEHLVTGFLSGNKYRDIEAEITLDEMCDDTIGFDIMFKDVDSKEEVMSIRINIPLEKDAI